MENENLTIACYCRVSKDDMNNDNQVKIITDYLIRNGFNLNKVKWFKEEMSSRKTRPIKAQMIQYCRGGMFDIVIVVRIDRFARSTIELVMDIEELVNKGIRFISINNGFDFNKKDYNSTNMLMLRIFSAFADFEREIIRERTNEGLARVKAQGKKLGRPKKTPPMNLLENQEQTLFDEKTDVYLNDCNTNLSTK